ncbi:MAG: hypothetical protein GX863_08275 [Firmicutes bacterium]|nr:hypothetical protein [Candidatus Fermentithermobacillaceae bacterium]
MALLAAVLLVAAKVLLSVLAGLVLLALLSTVLPVRVTVRGECRVEGDLDALEEFGETGSGATKFGETGSEATEFGETGSGEVDSGEAAFGGIQDAIITITPAGMSRVTVLGGSLGVEYHTDGPLRILIAGVPVSKIGPGERAGSKPASSEGREAVAVEAPHSVKRQRKAGFLKSLRSLRSRWFSSATARHEGRRRKRSPALTLRVEETRRWLSPEIRGMVFRTVRRLVKALRLRGRVHAECGFGDPGVTGMAYAAFVTWSGMTRQTWLAFEPDFVDSVMLARVEGETRFLPVQVAYIVGRFLLAREIRPLWRKKRAGESRKAPVLGAHTSG